jgi:hypothetical protein
MCVRLSEVPIVFVLPLLSVQLTPEAVVRRAWRTECQG